MAVERFAVDLKNEDDRARWLGMRSAAVNASEIGIVLGVSEWGSRAELYAEKKGIVPPKADNAILRRGRWLEPAAIVALKEERPHWDVIESAIYLLDQSRHLGATPDAFALRPDKPGRGVVETKVIGRNSFRRRWLIDEHADIRHGDAAPPRYYVLQALQQMMLADCQWGAIAALVNSEHETELRVFDVERDHYDEALIVDGVADFWVNNIEAGVMPDYVVPRDTALIRAMYPKDSGGVVDLTGNNMVPELVKQMESFTAAATRAKEIADEAKAELQIMLGEATYGQLADGRAIRWKVEPKKGYEVKPSNPRVLRIVQHMPKLEEE